MRLRQSSRLHRNALTMTSVLLTRLSMVVAVKRSRNYGYRCNDVAGHCQLGYYSQLVTRSIQIVSRSHGLLESFRHSNQLVTTLMSSQKTCYRLGIAYTLCSKNTHSHFLSYLHEWCVHLNKTCSEYIQGKVDSDSVEISYSLRPMTSLWRHFF